MDELLSYDGALRLSCSKGDASCPVVDGLVEPEIPITYPVLKAIFGFW